MAAKVIQMRKAPRGRARGRRDRPNPRVRIVSAEEWYAVRLAIFDGNIRLAAEAKQYRTERGVTQGDVAEAIGCHPSTIAWWETARTSWTSERLDLFKAAVNEAVEFYVWD